MSDSQDPNSLPIISTSPSQLGQLSAVSGPAAKPASRWQFSKPMVAFAGCAGIATVAFATHGLLLLAGGACGLALFFAIQAAKKVTAQHEQSMSLPPELKIMRDRLGSLCLEPPLQPQAARVQTQLARLEASLKNASHLLQEKLSPGELSYSRFENSIRISGSAIFLQLRDAVESLNQASVSGAREATAQPMIDKAKQTLDENEKALGALAQAQAAIAAMETNSSRVELPEAIHELEQIAARAQNLSLKKGDTP